MINYFNQFNWRHCSEIPSALFKFDAKSFQLNHKSYCDQIMMTSNVPLPKGKKTAFSIKIKQFKEKSLSFGLIT